MNLRKLQGVVITMCMLIGHAHGTSNILAEYERITQALTSATSQEEKAALTAQLNALLESPTQPESTPEEPIIQVPVVIPEPLVSQKKDMQQELAACNRDFDAYFTKFLNTSMLSNAARNTMHSIQAQWDIALRKTTEILKSITKNAPSDQMEHLKNRVLLLTSYIRYLKDTHLKLQPLTVGQSEYTHALISKPLSHHDYQNLLITISNQLINWLQQAWVNNNNFVSDPHDLITQTIQKNLPDYIVSPSSKLYRLTCCTKRFEHSVMPVIATNLYYTWSHIADDFLALIITDQQIAYTTDPKTYADHATNINHVLEQLLSEKDTKDKNITLIRNIFIAKLTGIKQKIALRQQLQQIATKGQTALALFIKHHSIVNTATFQQIRLTLPQAAQSIIDAYLTLTKYYFSQADHSALFIHDLERTHEQIKQLEAAISRSWFLCLFAGQHAFVPTLGIMDQMLTQISLTLKKGQNEQLGGIMQYILSGDWLSQATLPGIKSKNGIFSLEFANQILGGQHKDLKTAAFYALVYASPSIISKILTYLRPSMDKDLGNKVATVLNTETTPDKLIDFVNKNPEVFKQLTHQQPELLDLLASRVKHLVQEN